MKLLRANAAEYVPSFNNISSKLNILNVSSPENNSNNDKISYMVSNFLILKKFIENAVAIDCEMVGVGRTSVLAHVAIVDFNGNQLYNKYVIPRSGIHSITDYRTRFSGITSQVYHSLNETEHAFETVKRQVHNILNHKLIVGHALINDFKVLEYTPTPELVWDTTEINKYKQVNPRNPAIKTPRKLKVLAKEFANNNIQLETVLGHSPLEDARASMNLFRVFLGYDKVLYKNMTKA